MQPGYYFVTPDGERRFISATVNPEALNRLCDKHLTEETGWRYWIDRCLGLTVDQRPAWANWDHTDRFYDADMRRHGAIDL